MVDEEERKRGLFIVVFFEFCVVALSLLLILVPGRYLQSYLCL